MVASNPRRVIFNVPYTEHLPVHDYFSLIYDIVGSAVKMHLSQAYHSPGLSICDKGRDLC